MIEVIDTNKESDIPLKGTPVGWASIEERAGV